MTPRRRLAAAGAALLALAAAAGGCRRQPERAPAGTPVVLVTIDTLRSDRLGIYGLTPEKGGVATPAIDALARDGIVCEHAWATVPLTLPSHASLLTGLRPPDSGVRDNLGYRLDTAKHASLATVLAGRGYATGGFVSAFVLRGATGIGGGFETFDDAVEHRAGQGLGEVERAGTQTVDAALRWLQGIAGDGDAKPFFLWVHLFEPHAPYAPPEPYRVASADPYLGEIAAADGALGRLLDELRRRGLYDRALVVLAGDHGEGLGDHGEREHGILLYREALQVPLVVKLPRNARAGIRLAAPASLVDVVPTVLARLGVDAPAGLPGRDLLAEPDAEAPARALYAETLYPRLHFGWSELRSAVGGSGGRFQLIAGPDPELYDVVADPAERRNLLTAERRETAALRSALDAIPLAFETPTVATSPEEARKLAALGYASARAADGGDGPRPDPRREIGVLDEIRSAMELARRGRFGESTSALRAILERNPAISDARGQLAWNLAATGDVDGAIAEYREVARRSPEQLAASALEIARLELARGRLDEALAQAEVAKPSLPVDAGLVAGEVALRRGDAAGAIREAAALLGAGGGGAAPPAVAPLFLRGRAEAMQGDPAAAIADLERAAAEVDAGRAAPLAGLDAALGDLLARASRYPEAEAAFRRAIARFPQDPEGYVRLAYLLAAERRFGEILPTMDAMVAAVGPSANAIAADTVEQMGNREAAAAYRRRGDG